MTFHVAQILKEGGPWAAFLLLLGLVMWMRLSGRWVTEKELDRAIKGYVDNNDHLKTELAYFRQASADKDRTIQTMAHQQAQLMVHSEVSAYALRSITAPLGSENGGDTGTKEGTAS